MARVSSPTWIFDDLPPSGARRGGDPSEHAFKQDLDTFVREVIQNANDQSRGHPEVLFSFKELSGPELTAFQHALDWATLTEHIRATACLAQAAPRRLTIGSRAPVCW